MAYKSHSGNCPKCGTWRERLQRDHIIPRRECRLLGWDRKQTNDQSNIQHICANCHEDKTLKELRGRPSPNKGKKASLETRKKLSDAAKETRNWEWRVSTLGRKDSHETRMKKRARMMGNKMGFKKGGVPWNAKSVLTNADAIKIASLYPGITQRAIAQQFGVSRSTILHIIHGLRPDTYTHRL